jgi:hypothetical protein
MADLLQIISSNYVAVGSNVSASRSKYVNVDPAAFEGRWSGKYADGKSFAFQVSNVNGFRATAKYESGGTVKYQDVLIRDNSFRIGDSKFTLTKAGVAQIKTVMTSARGTQSLETAFAKQNG